MVTCRNCSVSIAIVYSIMLLCIMVIRLHNNTIRCRIFSNNRPFRCYVSFHSGSAVHSKTHVKSEVWFSTFIFLVLLLLKNQNIRQPKNNNSSSSTATNMLEFRKKNSPFCDSTFSRLTALIFSSLKQLRVRLFYMKNKYIFEFQLSKSRYFPM